MKKKLLYPIFFIYFTFVMLSGFAFAQTDSTLKLNKNIAELSATKLQQKILLTDKQTLQVKDILAQYLKQKTKIENNSEPILKKIESLLTDRQKPKYDIIKTEWWNYIQKELSKSEKK